MSHETYIGVSNTPKKCKYLYIGVNNTPKKVKYAYIGVNGTPKLIYSAQETPVVSITLASDMTYNDSARRLISSASCTGGTAYYGYSTSSTTEPSSWVTSYASLTATNAGTYYVWYKVTGNTGYSSIEPTYKGSVVISKATASVTVDVNSGLTETGSALQIIRQFNFTTDAGASNTALAVNQSSTTAPTSWDWNPSVTDSALKRTSAGTYYIWAKADEGTNYGAISAVRKASVTIAEATIAATVNVNLKSGGYHIDFADIIYYTNSGNTPVSMRARYVYLSTNQTTNTETYEAEIDEGTYTFSSVPEDTYYIWIGNGSTTSNIEFYTGYYITVSASTTYTVDVVFPKLTLTAGTGISAVSGGGVFKKNVITTIDATVKSGYTWKNWTRTSSGSQYTTTKSLAITMDSDFALTANATANS